MCDIIGYYVIAGDAAQNGFEFKRNSDDVAECVVCSALKPLGPENEA